MIVWSGVAIVRWSRPTKLTYVRRMLVLGWVTMFGFSSRCGIFMYIGR